ncbi:unnamed protein product, partial [Vitis vinifera]
MAEIAVIIVMDKLIPLLDQEARLLGGVHTQVEDIKTELLYFQAFLKDADAKGEKVDVSQGLKTWIQDLRETAYSIEDVIDEYLLHLGNPSRQHEKFYQARKEKVPEDINKMDNVRLITRVREYLQDKRYVVVFDDVWEPLFHNFCHITPTLPENKKGSRIIITTRNDDVVAGCKDDYIHRLPHLSPDSSWELFCKKAFQGSCPPELKKLSDDIVKRCGGLPLAIVAIGGLLSRKEKIVSEWRKFSDSLGFELESNSHLESINTILSLSYYDLPYQLKSCFLYLAIFPKDYTIKCGILTRLWIAEGFVKAKRGVTLEDTAEEFLTELIHRSLVQVSQVYIDGNIKRCHIHDLMREIILKKAEELSFCSVMAGEASCFDGRFRRLSIQNSSNNVLDITSKKSHIRSIFLYNSEMFSLETLASKFKLLKVLDLGGAPLDRIPEDLGNLFHLRYLSLRKTKVKMLPRSIGKLQNLQTLDLKYSFVEDLPVEINRLQKLRNILCFDFSYNADLRLGKLRQLRKLGITKLSRGNGQRLCASISDMVHIKYLSVCSLSEDEILDLQYISNPPLLLSTVYLMGRLEKLPDWHYYKKCNL